MPALDPWMWFVIILVVIFCITLMILAKMGQKKDLKNFYRRLPTLPPIPQKTRDDRIMSTVQEAMNDVQDGARRN